MLRAAIAAGSDLGIRSKAIMDRGDLVPDEVVVGIIGERLDRPDCAGGAVFDGFPRTVAQAEALDKMLAGRGSKIDAAIALKVDDEAMVGRMENRVKENPASARADDNPVTLKYWLGVYHRNTAPLLAFYGGQGKLKTVDGMAPVPQVAMEIRAILSAIGGKKTAR
jgi:adenylate kinase